MVITQKEATKDADKTDKYADNEKLLPGLENDIKQAEELKRSIEEKWQSKIEYLDTQMLQLRAAFELKKKRYDELTK